MKRNQIQLINLLFRTLKTQITRKQGIQLTNRENKTLKDKNRYGFIKYKE